MYATYAKCSKLRYLTHAKHTLDIDKGTYTLQQPNQTYSTCAIVFWNEYLTTHEPSAINHESVNQCLCMTMSVASHDMYLGFQISPLFQLHFLVVIMKPCT